MVKKGDQRPKLGKRLESIPKWFKRPWIGSKRRKWREKAWRRQDANFWNFTHFDLTVFDVLMDSKSKSLG